MNSVLSDKDFISKVEEFTSSPIQKKEDLSFIIDEVIRNGKEIEFEKLIFTAKYICGLLRVVKKAPSIPEVNSIDPVKKDLNEAVQQGIEQMKKLISNNNPEKQESFRQNYFDLSQQSFTNLTQLFSDLESVKKYLNHLKRKN